MSELPCLHGSEGYEVRDDEPGFVLRTSGLVLTHSASHSPCDAKPGAGEAFTGCFAFPPFESL